MNENCASCRNCYRLEKLDYSGQSCEHTAMDGYICMAFANVGIACWMVGKDINSGMCECYTPREE